jgi:hypothetical protein
MFRTLTALVVLTAASGPLLHADSLDAGSQPPPLVAVVAPPAAQPAPAVKPPSLGRHHIATSWYGYSQARGNLKFSYLDARAGEGGFFNYRYSLTRNIDLAVDGRGWINDADDDSVFFKVKSTVMHSGFGVRYTFEPFKLFYPYVQGNIYRTSVKVESSSKHYGIYQRPEVFWSRSGSGWGFGLNGGVEVRLGKLISIPVELSYSYSRPKIVITGYRFRDIPSYGLYCDSYEAKERFDVSNLTVSAGIGFNWGRVE